MQLLVKEPFVRLFVSHAHVQDLLDQLVRTFAGTIDFKFDHAPSESTVYAVTTRMRRYSVTATDKPQPAHIAQTRAVYIVENLDAVLDKARETGIEIAQDKSPVPIGFQARLRIADNNVMELAEWTPEHIEHLRQSGFLFSL